MNDGSRTEGLRRLREARGLSRGQLAQRAGVSEQQIRNLEVTRQWCRLNTAADVAGALEISIDELFRIMEADRAAAVSNEAGPVE